MKSRQVTFEVRPEDGYFIRDFGTNTVTCPEGYVLTKKCVKINGYTRYRSKSACSKCKNLRKCYHGKYKYKEIDFPEGAHFVKCKNWMNAQKNGGCR